MTHLHKVDVQMFRMNNDNNRSTQYNILNNFEALKRSILKKKAVNFQEMLNTCGSAYWNIQRQWNFEIKTKMLRLFYT